MSVVRDRRGPVSDPGVRRCAPVEIHPGKRYVLHNTTPRRIAIVRDGAGELVVAPLAERVVCGTVLAPFGAELRLLRQRHQLSVRDYAPPERSSGLSFVVGLTVVALIGLIIYDVLVDGTLRTVRTYIGFAAALVVVVTVLIVARRQEHERVKEETGADVTEGDIELGIGEAYYDGNETLHHTKHMLILVVALVVGALLPAIAIFVGTDAKDFLVMKGGLTVLGGKESRLISRVIQVIYTAVLSLFPALLYFQYDRQRVGTIRGTWVRSIFRMDRRMETLADVDARYGAELSEASGYSTNSARFLSGRHSPIIVATILIALGWTVLVLRTESFDFAGATRVSALASSADEAAARAQDVAGDVAKGATAAALGAPAASSAAEQAARASEAAADLAATSADIAVVPATSAPLGTASPAPNAQQSAGAASDAAEAAASAEAAVQQPFFQLLVPTPSAATMAFLGAYFFGVYLILRGYFCGDLRPKIYNQITARLVTVVVLAYLITVIFVGPGQPAQPVLVLSFLAGVIPTTVLQRIGLLGSALIPKRDKSTFARAVTQAFGMPRALTQIDGVDMQEAGRLESEGIPDVASLANSDLVSTMISTRLSIERLVDWTDQAVLILLLDDGQDEKLASRVVNLRQLGVRTASGLLELVKPSADRAVRRTVEHVLTTKVVERHDLFRTLATAPTADAKEDASPALDLLVAQIQREPAMGRILQWYSSDLANVREQCQAIIVHLDQPESEVGDEPSPRPAKLVGASA